MTVVLDTSVVIGRRPPELGPTDISVVTLAELRFGVLVANSEELRALRLGRILRLQREYRPLPIDELVAESYALLAARLATRGRQPRRRVFDLLIAATAHSRQAAVATRNAEDLRGLEDLVEIRSV